MREAEAVSVITMTNENKPLATAQLFLPKFEYAQDFSLLNLQCKMSNVNVIQFHLWRSESHKYLAGSKGTEKSIEY